MGPYVRMSVCPYVRMSVFFLEVRMGKNCT